jgi:hypothetical protein
LHIGNQTFSDLDEINVTFIRPMTQRVRDMMNYQKFAPSSREDLIAQVEREMLANPKRIPYLIGLNRQNPGKFFMVYKLSSKHDAQTEVRLD